MYKYNKYGHRYTKYTMDLNLYLAVYKVLSRSALVLCDDTHTGRQRLRQAKCVGTHSADNEAGDVYVWFRVLYVNEGSSNTNINSDKAESKTWHRKHAAKTWHSKHDPKTHDTTYMNAGHTGMTLTT